MFDQSAVLYDAFYDALGKDYEAETRRLRSVLASRAPEAKTLLDVACGTGRHLAELATAFDCVGLDIDGGLLDVARQRCPGVSFLRGDMVQFELGRQFDVLTCLFSSIGYVVTPERLTRAVSQMAAHVCPGGVVVVEPWVLREHWTDGSVQVLTTEHNGSKAVRMMRSSREDDVSVLDAHYLVGLRTGIEHLTERHELGLFTADEYTAAFRSAGLTVDWDEQGLCGRGLILGLKT